MASEPHLRYGTTESCEFAQQLRRGKSTRATAVTESDGPDRHQEADESSHLQTRKEWYTGTWYRTQVRRVTVEPENETLTQTTSGTPQKPSAAGRKRLNTEWRPT